MIAVNQLTVRAGGFALTNLSFDVPSGQYAVLMGKTGAGKTTLLEALCGLKRIDSGTIQLNGRDVTRLKPSERGVGYVPQDRALFQTLTVAGNLGFALAIRGQPRAAIQARVDELARMLGIEGLLGRKPQGLSGGEAQRVALGRALAVPPGILCLDEPLNALDDSTRQDMQNLLARIQKTTGVTILHVTHNLDEAEQLADRILVLDGGVIEARKVLLHQNP